MTQPPADPSALERFYQMGLTGNPFRELDRGQLAALYVPARGPGAVSAEAIAAAPHGAIQVVAAKGWGKSVLLYALEERLRAGRCQTELVALAAERRPRFQPPAACAGALLIDDGEHLGRRGLRRARSWQERGGGRLVVTSHEDLVRALGPGAVSLSIPRPDADLILRIFDRRLQASGGDAGRFRLLPAAAKWLEGRSEGNLRWIMAMLFEVFQTLQRAEEIIIDSVILEGARAKIPRQPPGGAP